MPNSLPFPRERSSEAAWLCTLVPSRLIMTVNYRKLIHVDTVRVCNNPIIFDLTTPEQEKEQFGIEMKPLNSNSNPNLLALSNQKKHKPNGGNVSRFNLGSRLSTCRHVENGVCKGLKSRWDFGEKQPCTARVWNGYAFGRFGLDPLNGEVLFQCQCSRSN